MASVLLAALSLTVGAEEDSSLPPSIIGEWQLLSNDTEELARGSLSATDNVLYIRLSDYPDAPFQVSYVINDDGIFSGLLNDEVLATVVAIEGRIVADELLGVAMEIKTPQARHSHQMKARP